MVAVVSSGGPPPPQYQRQTCWFYLTIALVVASCAFAALVLIKDGYVITNRGYVDHIIESCESEDGGN